MKSYILYPLLFFVFLSYQTAFSQVCGLEDHSNERLIVMLDEASQQALWDKESAQGLSFCISKKFTNTIPKLELALREAANEWMAVANVDFQLADDLSCENGSRDVLFPVIPAPRRARYAARAFFPNYSTNKRILRVKKKYLVNHEGEELKRLMMHELGHVLGFRHEHIHLEQGGACLESGGFESITSYDTLSIMHYSRCKPDYLKNYTLSDLDKEAATQLYPFVSTR